MIARVLTRPLLAAGFELAGFLVTRASDAAAAAVIVSTWADDADVAIVLVDEALYQSLPRDLLTRLDRRALPIVAPVPAPRWDERSEAEAYIREILRQAIGYSVRPR